MILTKIRNNAIQKLVINSVQMKLEDGSES